MTTTYKVTNQDKFNNTIIDLDTSGLNCSHGYSGGRFTFCAYGDLGIEAIGGQGGFVYHSGEHGQGDYEDEYGFILVAAE